MVLNVTVSLFRSNNGVYAAERVNAREGKKGVVEVTKNV